ncbi:MAG TPA: 30S ribosomal protein S12 methylthiotransferase RimO, partial [Planctomycetaceae bacterium]|nr:30S ribosomal protein S12 methylthiotransferase RimO [Planctomycetaceae bacterium]
MAILPIIDPSSDSGSQPLSAPAVSGQVKGRYAFITLGCPKNLVDSETMLGSLSREGYELVSEPAGSDFVVINTCGFIESSRAESRSVIQEMLDLKRAGGTRGVIVAGCLPERLEQDGGLLKQMPEIDHVVGVFGRDEITKVADRLVGGAREQRELFRPAPIRALNDQSRLRITPQHYAYLKISEGCNHSCSFCIIPSIRGKLVSRPVGDVLSEAQRLVKAGVKELLVISQDTSAYGVDVKFRTGFWNGRPVKTHMTQLAEALGVMAKQYGAWVRMHYVYPYPHVDEVIELMAEGKVLPYLDIPFQHGSATVLKRMKRPAHAENTLARITRWREICPDLTLRSTFIVGFPGETEEDFKATMDLVGQVRFLAAYTFQYSKRPNTPA